MPSRRALAPTAILTAILAVVVIALAAAGWAALGPDDTATPGADAPGAGAPGAGGPGAGAPAGAAGFGDAPGGRVGEGGGAGGAPARSPVAVNGRLRVCGVRLCNQAGDPIQLRGISSHGLQWFGDCVSDAALTALRDDWRANLFRVAMYVQEGGYETDPAGFTARVNEAVTKATALGLYVIIDFHVLTPGDPNVNLRRAKAFFADVAAAHAGKANVIYEIANEPNGVSWSRIKRYAEQVIPVIRAADPDGVVIVGTRGWSSLGVSEGGSEAEVVGNPVDARNVMYAFHFYAASHRDLQRDTVARAAKRLPLFVTEFGTQTFTGDGANDLASARAWLDLLDRRRIGYAMWSFSDSAASNSALVPGTCGGDAFAGTEVLTESGRFIRKRIRAAG